MLSTPNKSRCLSHVLDQRASANEKREATGITQLIPGSMSDEALKTEE
jgi:hypothetical protein